MYNKFFLIPPIKKCLKDQQHIEGQIGIFDLCENCYQLIWQSIEKISKISEEKFQMLYWPISTKKKFKCFLEPADIIGKVSRDKNSKLEKLA